MLTSLTEFNSQCCNFLMCQFPPFLCFNEGTNIRFVFKMFSCDSKFKNVLLYKQISLEYFHSCPPPQNRSRDVNDFIL